MNSNLPAHLQDNGTWQLTVDEIEARNQAQWRRLQTLIMSLCARLNECAKEVETITGAPVTIFGHATLTLYARERWKTPRRDTWKDLHEPYFTHILDYLSEEYDARQRIIAAFAAQEKAK